MGYTGSITSTPKTFPTSMMGEARVTPRKRLGDRRPENGAEVTGI
jgi:hypothetical protein